MHESNQAYAWHKKESHASANQLLKRNAYVPLQKVCKREHHSRSQNMPIGYVHMRAHTMIEGGFSDEI